MTLQDMDKKTFSEQGVLALRGFLPRKSTETARPGSYSKDTLQISAAVESELICPQNYRMTINQRPAPVPGTMALSTYSAVCDREEHIESCRLEAFGVERYETCEREEFGVMKYNECEVYLTTDEIRQFISDTNTSLVTVATSMMTLAGNYLSMKRQEYEFSCLISRYENDAALSPVISDLKRQYQNSFHSVFDHQKFNCSSDKKVAIAACDDASELCQTAAAYLQNRSWIKDRLQDATLLKSDFVATHSAVLSSELEELHNSLTQTLNRE